MAEELIHPVRACSKCGTSKPETAEHFPPAAGCVGGLRRQCRQCRNAVIRASLKRPEVDNRRKEAQRLYIESGRSAARNAAWRKANPDSYNASRKRYRGGNADRLRVADQERRDRNPEKQREKGKRWYEAAKSRPEAVLRWRFKARLRSVLASGKMGKGTFDLLGYTAEELTAHIEKQFTDGMTWDRLLAGEIHIDHIIPLRHFHVTDPADPQFRVAWGLANLQPLWAVDNLRKQGKMTAWT